MDDPNMATGDKTLTGVDLEQPGAHCAAGGAAIHMGVDTNGNGFLDDSEITSTTYVCAHKTLLREDDVASGAVCPGGGKSIRTGHDLNDDGVLEDGEIETTTNVCYSNELFHGDLKTSDFATPESQAKLAGVRVVTGNVTIDSDTPLPSLTTVGGNMIVQSDAAVELPALDRLAGNLSGPPRISAPALTQIGGSVSMTSWKDNGTFSAPALTEVDGGFRLAGKIASVELGKLSHVGGALDLDLVQATTLALPSLERADAGVLVSGWFSSLDLHALATTTSFQLFYSNLGSLSLPALESAASVRIGRSAALTTVSMPKLTGVTSLVVFDMPQLQVFDLPQITTLDRFTLTGMAVTDLSLFSNLRAINTLEITQNNKLADLHGLEQLTKMSGNLTIQNNPALASLAGLDGLTNVTGQIAISNNAALPAPELAAFLARLGR